MTRFLDRAAVFRGSQIAAAALCSLTIASAGAQNGDFGLDTPGNGAQLDPMALPAANPAALPAANSAALPSANFAASNPAAALPLAAGDATLDLALNAAGESSASETTLQSKVTLEYRKAPFMDVMRALAEAARVNYVVAKEVSETPLSVTVRLTDVTYEIAIKRILEMLGLASTVEDGILRITTQAALRAEREAKRREKKEVWLTEPTRMLVMQLNYAKAPDVKAILTGILTEHGTDDRFSVLSDERSNKVIVKGVADALVRAKSVIESLDKRKPQVLIEARIVEAGSELSKDVNITWGSRFNFDGQRGLSSGIMFPNSLVGNLGGAGILGQAAPDIGRGLQAPQFGTMGFSLGSMNGIINLDGVLRAYETENMAQILASPRILVQDREEADINENERYTRPVLQEGNSSASDRDMVSQIGLKVRPYVASDNSVELDVTIDRDSPLTAPSSPVSGVTRRTAKTKLVLSNGETAVIGGLYQTRKLKSTARIPFLGRLPIIGFLFRTNNDYSARSELMVFLTPRIIPVGGSPGGMQALGRVPTSPGDYAASALPNAASALPQAAALPPDAAAPTNGGNALGNPANAGANGANASMNGTNALATGNAGGNSGNRNSGNVNSGNDLADELNAANENGNAEGNLQNNAGNPNATGNGGENDSGF